MKKLLIVMLLLLLVVPATNSFSADFNWAGIWSENRYHDDTNKSEYFMLADAGVDTNAHNVFVKIPSWTNPPYPGGEYQKLNITPWFGSYDAYKHFKTADGYPSPGAAYENIDFIFFIDTNNNGVFDSSSEPYLLRNFPNGTFSQLPLVTNVKTSYSVSDVIVSWDGIPLGSHPNDQYQVRIIDKATGEFVFDSGKIDINLSNKYVYNLGELFAYGKNLYIAIEARQGIGNIGLANRSRYYAEPNLNSFEYAALWSENRYYESSKTSQYGMVGDTGESTNAYDVYMYIPSWTGQEYQKLPPYNFLGSYGAGKFFTTADGYPPPGGNYEARNVYFFIDENGSGDFNSSEPSVYRYYQSGRFSRLPLVTNVKTYYSGSDVMVSWDGIPLGGDFGDDGNDQYRVRIIDKATTEFYFDSGKIDINPTNKYVYNLGNLSAYGDNFWIAVEAREIIASQGMGLANRSRYYAELNSKSKAQAMPWIPLLLLDD